MKLAVFDLDHTLLPLDSGEMWVRWLTSRAGLDPAPVTAQLERFAREYRAGVIDINDFESFQMRFLAQFPRAFLNVSLVEYLEAVIAPALPAASRRLVEHYATTGAHTALCTATYSFVSGAVARRLGIDWVLAVQAEENDKGEFTGRLAGAPSYAEGKIDYVRALIKRCLEKGEKLEELAFYSDSIADKPLFDFVERLGGVCRAANPDEKLEQEARRRDWEVIFTYGDEELAHWRAVGRRLMQSAPGAA